MISRRRFLVLACAAAAASPPSRARATPAAMQEAIAKVTGGAVVSKGRVRLDVAPLIENGNSVVLSVGVDSPMTAAEYVKAIHVFAPANPLPNMVSAYLGPRSGRARITTRVRVADSQTLMAIAQLSDGSFWSDSAAVVVTLAACTEEVK
ncbi:MAG TPA: SoxY-related AACIE arm protein [Burkholderiales bacterium]|nr:SoxY-related AACIE arm protein [Burkholderiales bacterium]